MDKSDVAGLLEGGAGESDGGGAYDVLESGVDVFATLDEGRRETILGVVGGLAEVRAADQQERMKWALIELLDEKKESEGVRKEFPNPKFVYHLEEMLKTCIDCRNGKFRSQYPIEHSLYLLQFRRAVRQIVHAIKLPTELPKEMEGEDKAKKSFEASNLAEFALHNELPTLTKTEKISGLFKSFVGGILKNNSDHGSAQESLVFAGDEEFEPVNVSECGSGQSLVSTQSVLAQERDARKKAEAELKEEMERRELFWLVLFIACTTLYLIFSHSTQGALLLCNMAAIAYPLAASLGAHLNANKEKEREVWATYWFIYINTSALGDHFLRTIPSYLPIKFLLFTFLQLYNASATNQLLDFILED